MTEEEWLAFTRPEMTASFLRTKASRRKLLLFACAQERQRPFLWSLSHSCNLAMGEPPLIEVEFMERYADGLESEERRRALFDRVMSVRDKALAEQNFEASAFVREMADFLSCGKDSPRQVSSWSKDQQPVVYVEAHQNGLEYLLRRPCEGPGSLVHEIFGNPFRPVIFAHERLTSTVKAIATGIYEEKAFDRMPVLGDALEDAGCTNADILNHCRQLGEHVRGCWVVDLVSGKD